jgi:hypothetical protein
MMHPSQLLHVKTEDFADELSLDFEDVPVVFSPNKEYSIRNSTWNKISVNVRKWLKAFPKWVQLSSI